MLAYSISIHGNSNGDIEYSVDLQHPYYNSEDTREQVINEVIEVTRALVDNLHLRKEPISRSLHQAAAT